MKVISISQPIYVRFGIIEKYKSVQSCCFIDQLFPIRATGEVADCDTIDVKRDIGYNPAAISELKRDSRDSVGDRCDGVTYGHLKCQESAGSDAIGPYEKHEGNVE